MRQATQAGVVDLKRLVRLLSVGRDAENKAADTGRHLRESLQANPILAAASGKSVSAFRRRVPFAGAVLPLDQ
jgi:hypothetical protein